MVSNKISLQIRNLSNQFRFSIKSETIWRRVIKREPMNLYKYKLILKDLDNNDPAIKEYLYFPSSTFKSCPTDILKSLISDSFTIVKEKKMINNVEVYNSILRSYVTNNINFDVDHLLQEMQDNKIQFNQETYSLFIEYYCNIGKMDNVEILLEEMNSKNKEISFDTQLSVIKGYIIAGQSEKSKKYIVKNNLNENDCNISKALLMGYASIGQIDIIMDIINKMKDNNIYLSSNNYLKLYLQLAQSNVTHIYLDEILLVMQDLQISEIFEVICSLNRVELFAHSLSLIKKFKKIIENHMGTDLIQSFNTRNCPKEIYKEILTILLQFKYTNVYNNLFANMDFNESIIFANNIINNINSNHVSSSLVNKAINEKSIDKIEMALDFAKNKLIDSKTFKLFLILVYIPVMLESQMVSNCEELINLLPNFSKPIIITSFLYCLMIKDFHQFDNLQSIYNYRNRPLSIRTRPIATEMCNYYQSIEDFNKLAININTIFDGMFFTLFLSDLIIIKIINSSTNEDISSIHNMLKFTENFNIVFSLNQLNYLTEKANRHGNMFKCLFDRIDSC